MRYEEKSMAGTLFVNVSDNPKAPKLKGYIRTEDGTRYQVAAWTVTDRETGRKRLDKNGKPFLSVQLQADDGEGRKEQTKEEDPFADF